MKKKIISEAIALLALFILVLWFFRPILNNNSTFSTPDVVNSDITHFNYPLKYLLSNSLKNFSLPIWTDLIGTGFPLIGEAEIGAFYLPNILVFSLLPMPLAFNIGYVITFLFLACGMYLIGREYKFSKLTSFYCAVTFTFAGFYIVQIPHYNHLQAFSIFPFIFLCVQKIEKYLRSKAWLVLPFLLSQQIFSGHYQYVFMSSIFISFYIIIKYFLKKNKFMGILVVKKIFVTLMLSIGLGLVQILPSFEYFLSSSRVDSLKLFITSTSGLTFPHLFQVYFPYILGSPKNGSYAFTQYGIFFWESFLYIGIIPLMLALASLLIIKINKIVKIYWLLCLILIVLSFEGNSPFYIIFSLAPLSWFRMHSRFIGFVTFALVLLSAFTVDYIDKKIVLKKSRTLSYIVTIILVIISIMELWNFGQNYHSIENRSYLEKPLSTKYLSNDKENRIYTLGVDTDWYNEVKKNGWMSMSEYKFLLNGLSPNLNILYDLPQTSVYAGFALKKQQVVKQLINEGIDTQSTDTERAISPVGLNTLELLGVNFLISAYQISEPNFELVDMLINEYKKIYIYKIPSPKPLFYLSHRPYRTSSLREIITDLKDKNFKDHFDAIVDDTSVENSVISGEDIIKVIANSPIQKKFLYTSSTPGYFLLLNYFYPGWEAKIDDGKTKIMNGNISSMAVYAPAGSHQVEFSFIPKTLYIGGVVTLISLIIYCYWVISMLRRNLV